MKALHAATSSAKQYANKAGQFFNAWGGEYVTQKTFSHIDFMTQPETPSYYTSAEATLLFGVTTLLSLYKGEWLLALVPFAATAYEATITAKQLGGVDKAINFFKPAAAAASAPAPIQEEANAKKAN
jgi:hypothetical protein